MRTYIRIWLSSTVLALLALNGCGSSPTDSGNPDNSLARFFGEGEVTAIVRDSDTLLRMDGVEFESRSSATLTNASFPVLDKFAAVFTRFPGAHYAIGSYTDERGTTADNLTLTQNRANAVRSYLINALDGPAAAITATGYGETNPLDPASTAAAWAVNDRIEIVVTPPTGDPVFTVTVGVASIHAVHDCDSFTGSASAAAGDFYINAEIYADSSGVLTLIDKIPYKLFQLNDDETVRFDLTASGEFIASLGTKLRTVVGFYENDGGGVHQAENHYTQEFVYDPQEDCFKRGGDDACSSTFEGTTYKLYGVASGFQDTSGDPCQGWITYGVYADRMGGQ